MTRHLATLRESYSYSQQSIAQRACRSPVVAIMRWCTTPLGYGSKWVSPTTQPPGGTQGSTQPRPHRIFPPSSGENIQWGPGRKNTKCRRCWSFTSQCRQLDGPADGFELSKLSAWHQKKTRIVELVEALAWQKDPLPDAWQQYHLNSYKHADSHVASYHMAVRVLVRI